MKLTRIVLAVCAASLALPAAAMAQQEIAPPGGDNYLDAIFLRPQDQEALPLTPGVLGISVADTSNYTIEGPGGSFGADGEFNQCGQSVYGKTVWSFFTVDRTGRIDITAAGFDAVIGLASFRSPQAAVPPTGGPCVDRLAGRIESFPRDNLPTVRRGNWYAVQVGGFQNPQTGEFASGRADIAVELLPPERVEGDAGFSWDEARGGVKARSVRVDGPAEATATVFCARRSCGSRTRVRNPKMKGVFSHPVAKVDPTAKSSGVKSQPRARNRDTVHLANKNVFRGRTIKNGSRLVVIISAPDQIGAAFYWDVSSNRAGSKNIGCTEPGSTRIQRQGTCDGR